jgi:hypothetical protein
MEYSCRPVAAVCALPRANPATRGKVGAVREGLYAPTERTKTPRRATIEESAPASIAQKAGRPRSQNLGSSRGNPSQPQSRLRVGFNQEITDNGCVLLWSESVT